MSSLSPNRCAWWPLNLELSAPTAPVSLQLTGELEPPAKTAPSRRRPTAPVVASGSLWNLPALHSKRTRLRVSDPRVGRSFRVVLPEGAAVLHASALVREEVLSFPAIAGTQYYLHQGGAGKKAPGSLGQLPPNYWQRPRQTLALGSPEPDPQAVTPKLDWEDKLRTILPWVIAVFVIALGLLAFVLLGQKRE